MNTGLVVVSGEISTNAVLDIQAIVRDTIRRIGYVDADLDFSADSCAVLNAIDKQSTDIARASTPPTRPARAPRATTTSSTSPEPATRE